MAQDGVRRARADQTKGQTGLTSEEREELYAEPIRQEEVAFESSVFLLTKAKAEALKVPPEGTPQPHPGLTPSQIPGPDPEPDPEPTPDESKMTLRLTGIVPPEVWNRLGTKILPKLRSLDDLKVGIEFSASVGSAFAHKTEMELRQIMDDLGLGDRVRVERTEFPS